MGNEVSQARKILAKDPSSQAVKKLESLTEVLLSNSNVDETQLTEMVIAWGGWFTRKGLAPEVQLLVVKGFINFVEMSAFVIPVHRDHANPLYESIMDVIEERVLVGIFSKSESLRKCSVEALLRFSKISHFKMYSTFIEIATLPAATLCQNLKKIAELIAEMEVFSSKSQIEKKCGMNISLLFVIEFHRSQTVCNRAIAIMWGIIPRLLRSFGESGETEGLVTSHLLNFCSQELPSLYSQIGHLSNPAPSHDIIQVYLYLLQSVDTVSKFTGDIGSVWSKVVFSFNIMMMTKPYNTDVLEKSLRYFVSVSTALTSKISSNEHFILTQILELVLNAMEKAIEKANSHNYDSETSALQSMSLSLLPPLLENNALRNLHEVEKGIFSSLVMKIATLTTHQGLTRFVSQEKNLLQIMCEMWGKYFTNLYVEGIFQHLHYIVIENSSDEQNKTCFDYIFLCFGHTNEDVDVIFNRIRAYESPMAGDYINTASLLAAIDSYREKTMRIAETKSELEESLNKILTEHDSLSKLKDVNDRKARCNICATNPKDTCLPCGHMYCRECLNKTAGQSNLVTCPNDRRAFHTRDLVKLFFT